MKRLFFYHFILVVAVCLAGCNAVPMAALVGDDTFWAESGAKQEPPAACPTCQQVKQEEKGDQPTKAPGSPLPPHTLSQAVCAYFRCLQAPKAPIDAKAADRTDQKSPKEPKPPEVSKNGDKKAPSGNGKPAAARNGDKNPKPDAGDEPSPKKENGAEKDKDEKEKDKEPEDTWYSAHGQGTIISQFHGNFRSPYLGPNSLNPENRAATTETATLFLAARLWDQDHYSGEFVFNPEISGGNGFSGTMGLAGFSNGEATRVGEPQPTPYIARCFLRQTWGFCGEQEKVEDGPNEIAGKRDVDRVTLTIGKLTATDLVDDNRYSHDPRTQFLNWSLMFDGAWDYPANVRGYTYGFGLDFNTKCWAARYAAFTEPAVANGAEIDPRFLKANGQVVELERRFDLDDHPGKVRLLSYLNHAHMGDYRESLIAMPVDPEITQTREYRFKYGFGLNVEQEITKDFGTFARLGWNDGHTESWAFTEIDRTAALGCVLQGRCWCRPQDQIGLGAVCNGLSKDHRDYLAAGGIGFIIGDGQLNYGLEEILETYYNLEVRKGINVTLDFQEVNHPAYNKDRGPVAIGSVRVHFEY